MKLTPIAFALMMAVPAGPAMAGSRCLSNCPFSSSSCDKPARWASRHDLRDAVIAITTESGEATLLLSDNVVAMQLSDRTIKKVRKELRESQDENDSGPFGEAIKTVVFSVVRSALNHSIECPIRELRNVEYENGELVFTTEDGDRLFRNVDINDSQVLEDFSENDARAFVREFKRLKHRI